ncbi:hypothetical protein BDC45DRAFT_575813 [Circinella umbellata]|nr:hypothetical protein BDC45DRAFT_575813 [Circinella umbellata]
MQDLGITAIHHALQFPTDLESIRTHEALAQADAPTVDRVLKRILSYLQGRNQRWPDRRLFRCLDYIVQRSNHQATRVIFQLRSFRSCLKAALDRLAKNSSLTATTTTTITTEREEGGIQYHDTNNKNEITPSVETIIKLIGNVLEHPSCNDRILMDIRQNQSIMYILQWITVSSRLEIICLHALAAKGKFFAKDMIGYDAFWTLAGLVGRVPDLLLLIRNSTTTTNSATKTLYLCLKAARIFENLLNYAKSSRSNTQCLEKAVHFVHSVNFIGVARGWEVASSHYLEDPDNSTIRKLMHSLTSIVSSCVAVSKDVASRFLDVRSSSTWRATLSYDMKTFLNHMRQQQQLQQDQPMDSHNSMNSISITTPAMDEIALRMQRLIRITLSVVVSNGSKTMYRQSSVDELIQDMTVFLLLLGFDVIVPEQITTLGRPAASGSINAWFGDCDFHHISSDKAILFKKYQDFFVVLLESYIQHLQLASEWMVINVSGYIAYFLINILSLLTNDSLKQEFPQKEGLSPIQARLQKLVSYFLHFDNAVQVFAKAPTYLNDVIWLPTIQTALQGLKLFTNGENNDLEEKEDAFLMEDIILSTKQQDRIKQERKQKQENNQTIILYKSRRAFSVLRTVTKFSNACAKLEQAGALQMVNINFIPNNFVGLLEKDDMDDKEEEKYSSLSVSVLNVYASFTHFIAALASTMALIRAKLRDAFSIGPVIMKLLWQASHRVYPEKANKGLPLSQKEDATTKKKDDAWAHVVTGCLMVINAFEFDNESLQKWLAWPPVDDAHERNEAEQVWITPQMTSSLQGRLSVLPAILHILLSQQDNLQERMNGDTHMGMLLQAANAFNLLSLIPECGIQLVRDTEAMQMLCVLLKGLLEHRKNTTHSSLEKAEVTDNIKMDEATSEMSIVQDEQEDHEMEDRDGVDDRNGDFESTISDSKKSLSSSASGRCFDFLHRGLVRVLTSQENMRFIISSDVLTAFLKPLRTSMIEMDSHKLELSRMLCQSFSEERLEDFIRLFRFTLDDDNATRLHELCAVATSYACPNPLQWGTVLGIQVVEEEEIIQSKSVFGALCRMLVYDLLEQDSDTVYEAPYRRPAAAQAIEILTQVLIPSWIVDCQDMYSHIQNSKKLPKQQQRKGGIGINNKKGDDDSENLVTFITEYSNTPIIAKRVPLIRQSSFFAALLSGEYAENSCKPIKLMDITDHALKLFLDVVHSVSMTTQVGDTNDGDGDNNDWSHGNNLPSSMQWSDIINILLAADRYGNESVANVCEEWISRNLFDKQNKDRLNGAILLFRKCRDPDTMDAGVASDIVWPFQKILKQALMVIVTELSISCQTIEFNNMVQNNDEHELSSFCQGITVLICSSIIKLSTHSPS